ncbi:MAG: hypothetical protein ACOCQY_05020 [Halorhabdus sp.]
MSLLQTILTGLVAFVGFAIGAGSVPFLCFVIASATPGFIAEPVANVLFKLNLVGMGPSTIHQTENDQYELRRAHEDGFAEETPRKWTRWAWQQIGFSFDSTPEAWGTRYAEPEFNDAEPVMSDEAPEDTVKASINRGGKEWYARYEADGMRVRLGAALARLKGRSNLETASRSLSEGLKEHGGDTNNLGVKWQAGGFMFLFIMSSAMGFVVFF